MNLSEAAVLLVDDESELLEIFRLWLAGAGCRNVYTASNGEAALVVLDAVSIDLLVTDLRMPVMGGITLVRKLRERIEPIPSVIFVSGFGDIDHREMYDLGVEVILTKPLFREDLIKMLERTLVERDSLWLTPMEVSPKQSMLIYANRTGETADVDSFRLGRGGFSVRYSDSVKLGKVSFQCCFPTERPKISGEGYVRWFSKSDQIVGIEFAFLDPTCRSRLLEEIAATNPRSFIPSFL